MIRDRIQAWLDRSVPAEDFGWGGRSGPAPADDHAVELAAAHARIAELEGRVKRQVDQVIAAQRRAEDLHGRADRLARDLAAAQAQLAGECVCGGDPELTLRQKLVAAEQRAARDRANANVMADRLARHESRPVIGRPVIRGLR